ncbi:TorF family putative porin [Flavobacterium flavipallidum]|uniref:TorF family putative porin n=1 Tax=Flavobacterium flavipallidum TaxID=3139140 RepID=A0ABU9HLH1_9FLAO
MITIKKFLFQALFLLPFLGFSQEMNQEENSIPESKKWEFNLDLMSRYLWRGQCWGGNYLAIQPTVEYAVSPKLAVGTWATTNFKKEYFYPDNETSYKGYHEVDLYLSYQINDFLQFQLWDYYWPSVSKVEGVSNKLFDYGPTSSQTVDAILYFDFSEGYRYPFNATISTFILGNDYRYDRNDNPKHNYTTYLELGYTLTLFKNIELLASSGVVLNNKAAYYTFADYDKPSLVNLSLKATKEIPLFGRFSMPISLNFVHNAATKNTDFFGKDFLVAGVSFGY